MRRSSQILFCGEAAPVRTALKGSRCDASWPLDSATAVARTLLISRELAIRSEFVRRAEETLDATMSGSVGDDSSSSRSMTSWVTSNSAGSSDASPATSDGTTCKWPPHSALWKATGLPSSRGAGATVADLRAVRRDRVEHAVAGDERDGVGLAPLGKSV